MEYNGNKIHGKIKRILEQGANKPASRTAEGTRSLFVDGYEYDLTKEFPIYTGKHTNWENAIKELCWMYRGETNINTLGCKIWDRWADENGELGPVYGKQWADWEDTRIVATDDVERYAEQGYEFMGEMVPPSGATQAVVQRRINQLDDLVERLRTKPHSRHHVVIAWNPSYLPNESKTPQENVADGQAALASCHMMFQCYVEEDRLSLFYYQRSADSFLGVPFNEVFYAANLLAIAATVGLKPHRLIPYTGDTHLYDGQIPLAEELVERECRPLVKMRIKNVRERLCDYVPEDFELVGELTMNPPIRIAPQV